MPRLVTFGLGFGGSHLSGRSLVTRDVSTVPPTTVDTQSLAGTVEVASVEVESNGVYEATLVDTAANGEAGKPTTIKFNSFDEDFQSGPLSIIAWDEMSESSASSLSSSSSTSTLSSSSTSTLSSSSSHSRSSSSSLSSSSSSSSTSSLSSSSTSSISSSSSSSSISSSSVSSSSS